MARTKLSEREAAINAKIKELLEERKEARRASREAERKAHARRVEITGEAILALAESKDENTAKLYRCVMELLDAEIEKEDDRKLFALDDDDTRKALGLKPKTAQPVAPAA